MTWLKPVSVKGIEKMTIEKLIHCRLIFWFNAILAFNLSRSCSDSLLSVGKVQ